jgi:16S rRNA processing protein RimM
MPVPGGAKVGWISKPYGLRGEVSVILEEGAGLQMEPGDPLFISVDGQRVPFFIEEIEPGGNDQLIIKFEFIGNVEEARRVCGCDVFLDPARRPVSNIQSHHFKGLIGWMAFDAQIGLLGPLTGFMDHEYNPMFLIRFRDREILVPAREEFIQKTDPDQRAIFFTLPEGITDL